MNTAMQTETARHLNLTAEQIAFLAKHGIESYIKTGHRFFKAVKGEFTFHIAPEYVTRLAVDAPADHIWKLTFEGPKSTGQLDSYMRGAPLKHCLARLVDYLQAA